MRIVLATAAIALLAACEDQTAQTTVPFRLIEVAFIDQHGLAVIEGRVLLRHAGGEMTTCAGGEVGLIPAGAYANQRIAGIYGNTRAGYASSSSRFGD